MSLHKIYNFVGYNNLGLILEQERKHWLLKPDKKLNVQDSVTGSIFVGRMDNLGNEVIVESNKTDAYTGSDMFKFVNDMFNVVFEPLSSSLPYNNALNGLMYECIISSKIAYVDNNVTTYKNYKLKFVNCEEVLIPFGDSLDSGNVYSGKWIKTTSLPQVLLPDGSNAYNIIIPLQYETNVTGLTFYYPLEPNMQPLSITQQDSSTYVTEAITDSSFIGYPIYWFTSDNTNVGPSVSISNNVINNRTLFYIANPGNVSKYITEIFCCVDGNNDATPSGGTDDWKVTCETVDGDFTNTTADVNIPIDMSSIKLVQISTGIEYPIPIVSDNHDTLTLTSIENWTRSGNTAETLMSDYDMNCYETQHDEPLIPLFILHLDENISFMHNTTDVGYAGMHASSELYSETTPRYPYSLGEWDGIPEWINNNEQGAPQHTAIYAIHNTPNYNENDPKTRQTSAILLDPGKPRETVYSLTTQKPYDWETNYTSYYTYDSVHEMYVHVPVGMSIPTWVADTYYTTEFTNDERGRAYLISNDDATYENNATAEFTKPARTIARICDIPTTLVQLSDITGLSPTTVVDKKYVHTDVCYTAADKEKLYNTLANRWVRPINVDSNGSPIETRDNDYIFSSVEDLNKIDLTRKENDFCEYINLNPVVPVDPGLGIEVDRIVDGGSGYNENDIGIVIIGGTSINYTVTETSADGVVTAIELSSTSTTPISLSNFDLLVDQSGEKTDTTSAYGTSPTSPNSGTGLRFMMKILNYDSIRTKRAGIYNGLFALVKLPDGLWLYQYENDNWVKKTMVSEAESSTIVSELGGLSTTDAYMTSIVSSIHTLPVGYHSDHQAQYQMQVIATPSFINVTDEGVIPFTKQHDNRSVVDFNKIICLGVYAGKAQQHDDEGRFIMEYLKQHNRNWYDCYIIWKWDNPNDYDNTNFRYGILQRSFNNFVSTDTTTTLPGNTLNSPAYVHTNEQTTIVWNTEHGTMLWVYDAKTSIKESYAIHSDTNDITLTRSSRSWEDVDLYNDPGTFRLVDDDGKLIYNISTNNPNQVSYEMLPDDPIYQQPTFKQIAKVGDIATEVPQPIGTWRLVYPRINSYTFENTSGLKFDAIKMDILRGENVGTIGNVTDENGNIVNKKILVIDRQTRGSVMKVYNSQTNTWDTV